MTTILSCSILGVDILEPGCGPVAEILSQGDPLPPLDARQKILISKPTSLSLKYHICFQPPFSPLLYEIDIHY